MTKLHPDFTPADVEILERRECHRGFLRVDQIRLKHRLHEGGWSQPMDREVLIRQRAVGVLLFDPDRDELVMIRQFRVGLLEERGSPWILELVAGLIDTEESPEEVAVRESGEESGMYPADLIKICDYYNSPGGSNEHVTLFCGRVDSSDAGGVHGLEEENEDIEVVVLTLAEALAAMETGVINNAMSVIGIQWLVLNKPRLRRIWQK